ncbi:MAG: phosphoribosylformylglycinamidine cyclo-ligase [Candidatus Levybacteria bacterium]|nr:phosphoribosylformylglycinamidine cyclo-ligase [Candidatus Levybacteria bacterium]
MKKITYKNSGVNYEVLDPVKKFAQDEALLTGKNLITHKFSEVTDTRGESAYVWLQGDTYMATVIEGLGTKNLVADAVMTNTKTYYENIGYDTVASIINDLISVGARPLTVHAYWAIGDAEWLSNTKRMKDLIKGFAKACHDSGASWGGGETPTLKGIIDPKTIDLGGSAVGFIKKKEQLLTDKNIKVGDRIIFIKSNGINVNGLSLARQVASKLPQKYETKLKTGKTFGQELLNTTHIYAKLLADLFDNNVSVHYVSNITGHGLRKIMRGKGAFTYEIEKVFESPELFQIIQKHAGLTDYEMYETFNMGQDFALFVSPKDVSKTLEIIKKHNFRGMDAGVVAKGKKQVKIIPKNITFDGSSLDLR